VTDHQSFLASIITNPDDDVIRLGYADWLDEQAGRATERAELIRVQVELWRTNSAIIELVNALPKRDWDSPEYARVKELMKRGFYLLGSIHLPEGIEPTRWRRGFVEEITTSPELFLKHADAIIWHPEHKKVRCAGCDKCKDGMIWTGKDGMKWIECRVPRPCPETAQPIRMVSFTQDPRRHIVRIDEDAFRPVLVAETGLTIWRSDRWTGIEFTWPDATEAVSDDDLDADLDEMLGSPSYD